MLSIDPGTLRRSRIRRALLLALGVYAALLIVSNATQMIVDARRSPAPIPGADRSSVTVPRVDAQGRIPGAETRLSILRWTPSEPNPDAAPLLLLHGSPGRAADFRAFAPSFQRNGREVIAIDLPGFGYSERSAPDYGIGAQAHVALETLDALGVPRAHVVGWSLGGGAALRLAELAPDRVSSVTLLASVGTQQVEGSGSYGFERFKYALGFVALVGVPEFVPHFGVLGPRGARVAFLRSFWDTDLRPMHRLMRDLETPTLMVHGRNDFLVPAWGAELHHEIMGSSRLVMLDAGHFLPFPGAWGGLERATPHVEAFVQRHDDPGAPPLPGRADFAPVETAGSTTVGSFQIVRGTHWLVIILLIIVASFISEDATVIAVGLAIAHQEIDIFVGLIGCFVGIVIGDGGLWAIGRFFGRRALRWPVLRAWVPEESIDRWGRWFDRHTIQAVFIARALPGTRMPTYFAAGVLSQRAHGFLLWAALAAFLWTPFLLLLVIVLGPRLFEALRSVFAGPVALLVCVLVFFIGVRMITGATTWTGRRRIVRDFRRLFRYEFWPSWLVYLPVLPWIVWLGVRRGGLMTFTCANPGIPYGGGVVGESKQEILDRLAGVREWIIQSALIEAGGTPEERALRVDELVRERAELGGYPVVLKPDAGQRGRGFKVVRTPEEAESYLRRMPRAVVLQRFHPGPHEIGVMWAREPGEAAGRITGVTKKIFPEIEGDGVRTLERLIWTHPRYLMQAEVFLKRHDAQRDRVLAKGERMRLGVAGNHCQGTRFADGADLITPALEARVNEIAMAFDSEGFDIGRFDLRYADEDALRRGEGFIVVELNGVSSEPTNIYDPARGVVWAYKQLYRHWDRLFAIGHVRRKQGVRSMSLVEMLRAVRDHYRGRPGTRVSD
ncbi:MAG: alpha/beta fold hydrolase [Phycisphaerales bacterium]|nr:MAG: alpha/beta fold hydrolase [Phycisphaerales bacterium]